MAHDYHDILPGYDPAQILHDGCAECEVRSKSRNHGIANLDRDNFYRAWSRAADWNQGFLESSTLSAAEVPMLDVLWAVQVQLERWSVLSIGYLPDQPLGRKEVETQ